MGIDLRNGKTRISAFGKRVVFFVKKVGGVLDKKYFPARSVFLWLVGVLVAFYLASVLSSFYQRLSASWNEIAFAYQHPSLVGSLREDYAERLRKIEEAILTKEPTAEEKLLNEITSQLQELKD